MARAAASGEESAWRSLVDRFAGLVWSVIQGYRLPPSDAADVSQTTWLRLAEHLGTLRDPERLGGWLATTAGHECLRVLRLSGRQVPTDEVWLAETPDADVASQPEPNVLRSESHAELWSAFTLLPAKCQMLLRLLFADPTPSYDRIALATGMSVGSIGPTRGRCLEELRERMTIKGYQT